jgi:purine-cytosine permease-like protein
MLEDLTGVASKADAFTVENHGVDTIPINERTFRPIRIFSVLFGSDLTYSVIIFGSFPILFGLSFWASIASIIAGCFVGGLALAPMGLMAPRTGTNNAVSSGAHFGVAGRFIGTSLALFSALGFVAITVWTSGDAVVSGVARMTGGVPSPFERGIGYGLIMLIVLWVAVRGVHMMIRIQERVMIPLMGVVMLLGVVAFAPKFNAGYAGGKLLFGSFAATFTGAALVQASVVISYGVFIGDWARYINPDLHPDRRIAAATFLGGLVGLGVPILWGAYVSSTFAADAGTFVPSLIAHSPGWYVIGLVLLGGVAGVAQGTVGLYGTGLDTSSLIPRLSRQKATVVIAATAALLVFLGAFVWDAVNVVNAFLVILVVVTTPWIIVMTIGYFHRRRFYLPDDLQVFTRGARGGRYWYTAGVNWRAATAWVFGAGVGLMFSAAPPVWTGPWANLANGVDLSLISGASVTAVLFTLLLLAFPEPGYVFGPNGPAFGRVRDDATATPISGASFARADGGPAIATEQA